MILGSGEDKLQTLPGNLILANPIFFVEHKSFAQSTLTLVRLLIEKKNFVRFVRSVVLVRNPY